MSRGTQGRGVSRGIQSSTLAGRLAPHIPERFDATRYGWWRRPDGAGSGGPRPPTWSRIEQLAQIVERLVLLIEAGHPVAAAVDRIVADAQGVIATELGAVAEDLAAGRALGEALRAWARASGCDAIGALAAAVRRTASVSALSTALHAQARLLRRRAHRHRVQVLERRIRALWLAALVVAATSGAAVMP